MSMLDQLNDLQSSFDGIKSQIDSLSSRHSNTIAALIPHSERIHSILGVEKGKTIEEGLRPTTPGSSV